MKALIGAALLGAALVAQGASPASACDSAREARVAADPIQLAGDVGAQAGDAPITDPSVPGMGGSGGGVPGKSEMGTGAADPSNDDTDMDRDGDMDAYEGAMEDSGHATQAGDAPAAPLDRAIDRAHEDLDAEQDPVR